MHRLSGRRTPRGLANKCEDKSWLVDLIGKCAKDLIVHPAYTRLGKRVRRSGIQSDLYHRLRLRKVAKDICFTDDCRLQYYDIVYVSYRMRSSDKP